MCVCVCVCVQTRMSQEVNSACHAHIFQRRISLIAGSCSTVSVRAAVCMRCRVLDFTCNHTRSPCGLQYGTPPLSQALCLPVCEMVTGASGGLLPLHQYLASSNQVYTRALQGGYSHRQFATEAGTRTCRPPCQSSPSFEAPGEAQITQRLLRLSTSIVLNNLIEQQCVSIFSWCKNGKHSQVNQHLDVQRELCS